MVISKAVKTAVKIVLINPVFTAAFICAVLFYTDSINIKDRQKFVCLFNLPSVTEISGTLVSSPVKSSTKESYSADFFVSKAVSVYGESLCKGTVKLLLPSNIIEQNLPGKLYTAYKTNSGQPFVYETGLNLKLKGSFFEGTDPYHPFFLVEATQVSGFSASTKGRLLKLRALCRLQFKRLMYGWGKAGGLLLALLSGSREYTDSCLSEAFRNSGLSHILALSGMHLSLFGGIAFFFGNKITRRNTADLLQLTAIVFFVWFAGLSPSLFRALVSSIILFINSSLRMRRFKGLTVLSATFLLHIMIYPWHMKSAAFLLSYGALAGIMTVGQTIKHLCGKRIFPSLGSKLSESAGAQFFTAPVTISLFGKLMPVGIISTIFVSPLVILFLYTGLAGTILCLLLPFLATAFNDIMNCIYFIIETMVFLFAKVPPVSAGISQ